MNHIFKKIWNKSLGRMIVVSENAKSAGKTDNTTGIQQNSLSNVHDDEQGKNFVFSFKPLVLKSLVLSIAAITGVNVWADDNYAHISTDTALGSAKGYAHATTKEAGTNKITKVGGITVTTTGTGTSLDDIDSFTANSIKITDPTAVAAFINAAKKGGNIAIGDYSSAMGTANIALGSGSSAMGFENSASGFSSSAVGFRNEASGQNSNAVGVNNIASGNSSSALGTYNIALGGASNAMGYNNAASGAMSSALGYLNNASGVHSTAVGSENVASAIKSSALGHRNQATGFGSIAVGNGFSLPGQASINGNTITYG
ncbi:ESPR-type extended signal peptide-containing protein, partial [Acinetobacter junii]|uniref:ESPR-type extended signal peptide-containing protein n=1 Tax=Acinetobacter junii TaxID=40215 RepID=UPI0034CFBE9D